MSGMIRAFYRGKLDDFKKLVEAHDLTYSFSDDHRVWTAGQASWEAIDEDAKGLLPRAVAKIWNDRVKEVLGDDPIYLMTEQQWKERTDA